MKHFFTLVCFILLASNAHGGCPTDLATLIGKELTFESLGIVPTKRYVRRGSFQVLLESSGEVELPIGEVIRDTETEDGTLKPMLLGFSPPDWFTAKYRRPGVPIEHTEWEKVADADRIALIQHILAEELARRRAEDDRSNWPKSIPGVTFKRSLQPGKLSHGFLPELEFVWDLDPSYVEIKYRGPLLPSETRRVLMAQFPNAPSLHVHAIAPMEKKNFAAAPKWEAARILDRTLRYNLMAEMMSIVHKGYPITPSEDGSASGTLHGPSVGIGVSTFSALAEGIPVKLRQSLKMGLVGTRADEDYDHNGVTLVPGEKDESDDVYLLGAESRFLRRGKAEIYGEFRKKDERLLDAFLDKTQELIAMDSIGSSEAQLKRWLSEKLPGSEMKNNGLYTLTPFENAWYNRPIATLFSEFPNHLYALAVRERFGKASDFVKKFTEATETGPIPRHEELKMLIHDWSSLPLIYGNDKLIRRIERAQVVGIQAVLAGKDPTKVMRSFLIRSGLYKEIAKSLDLQKYLPWQIRWRP